MTRTLEQALLTLLAQFPFESLTTQQIADEALIHRTTFYAHFDDKYALLAATLQAQFDQVVVSPDELTKQPFKTLARLSANGLAAVVTKQRADEAFQSAMLHLFFSALSEAAGQPTRLANYLLIGRVKAVVHWVRETEQPENVYTAGEKLDRLMVQAEHSVSQRLL